MDINAIIPLDQLRGNGSAPSNQFRASGDYQSPRFLQVHTGGCSLDLHRVHPHVRYLNWQVQAPQCVVKCLTAKEATTKSNLAFWAVSFFVAKVALT
jgi:hypothetical protein